MTRYDITVAEACFMAVTLGAILVLAYFEWMQ